MTDDELLSVALNGSPHHWAELHEICSDRERGEALARLLERHAHTNHAAATSWAQALEEMHPGLKVKLPAAPTRPAAS